MIYQVNRFRNTRSRQINRRMVNNNSGSESGGNVIGGGAPVVLVLGSKSVTLTDLEIWSLGGIEFELNMCGYRNRYHMFNPGFLVDLAGCTLTEPEVVVPSQQALMLYAKVDLLLYYHH